MKISKDCKNKMWSKIENEIQIGSKKKDGSFILSGNWKKFVRKQNTYKIYKVDGSWVRHNLSCFFGHGGHGLVHEFIPFDEIWIASHHPYEKEGSIINCVCKLHKRGQKMSEKYFNSTTLHEIEECDQMKKGKAYWSAHNLALKKERRAKILIDPYSDL